jgi:hypothetical protein
MRKFLATGVFIAISAMTGCVVVPAAYGPPPARVYYGPPAVVVGPPAVYYRYYHY